MENPDTHSTLEVVPETDLPEVVPGVGKEVVPTPLPTSGTERKWSGLSEFLRKKKFLGAIIIFVIGASLVGGTVGGTWNRDPIRPSDTLYPNTSLAATILPRGERRVYFQDASGSVREARYNPWWSPSKVDWDTSPSLIVSKKAINGTSLAVDSADLSYSNGSLSAGKSAAIYVAYAAVTVNESAETKPAPGATFVQVSVQGALTESWEPTINGSDAERYPCAANSSFAVIALQNQGNLKNGSNTGPTHIWYSLFYQPPSARSNSVLSSPIHQLTHSTVFADVMRPFGMPSYIDPLIMGSEPGRSFSVVRHGYKNDTRSATLSVSFPSGIYSVGTDLLNGSCNRNCDGEELTRFGLTPDHGDIVAAYGGPSQQRTFYLYKGVMQTYRTNWNENFDLFSEHEYDLSIFRIRPPFPKFTVIVTVDKSATEGVQYMYLYYQLNGTHLAEVGYKDGLWSHELSLIRVD